ncbi:MAG: hypothetical protein CO187_10090 [Zetaproteobacteria bacterium CG_4_9_14_3_um_filter_53_7]|nr:MAG: hypothetical protein CO187_10090 [Zetaproteobacteria bacterium CG_4_9_14_3_um_filter_53_7]
MDLVNFFGLAIFGILALSLLSFTIDAIKSSSSRLKITVMIVILLILTGAITAIGYPLLFV